MVECWEQDGYRVARPEYFTDSLPPTASEAQVSLHALCQSVDQLANVWLDKVRYYAQDVVLVWVLFMAVLLTFSRPSILSAGCVQNLHRMAWNSDAPNTAALIFRVAFCCECNSSNSALEAAHTEHLSWQSCCQSCAPVMCACQNPLLDLYNRELLQLCLYC